MVDVLHYPEEWPESEGHTASGHLRVRPVQGEVEEGAVQERVLD